MDFWKTFRIELDREAEAIFASSGEIIVVSRDPNSESVLVLTSRTKSLMLTFVPDKNLVRWDSTGEYSFERLSADSALLARTFMKKLRIRA
jgi:hypothetical protein